MKRQLTPEQTAARDARRAKFKTLWKQVADMPEAERLKMAAGFGFMSCDGNSYSAGNMMLIALQAPTATVLGGFRQWLKHGRQVRKGEHGLMIWVPCGYGNSQDVARGATAETGAETPERRQGFIVGTIFDISQTEAVETAERLAA